MGVTVALLFAFNVFLSSQALDAEATAQREFGPFSLKATPESANQSIPLGDARATQLATITQQTDTESALALTLFDFTLPTVVDDGLRYVETDWGSGLQSRYSLHNGEWPTGPGEVVLAGVQGAPAVGERVKTLGSDEGLLVVGHARGRFGKEQAVLAGVGTWSDLEAPADPTLAQLAATATFYLPPGTAPAEFASRVNGSDSAAKIAREVGAATQVDTRESAGAFAPKPWIDRSPLLFWLPALSILPLCVLMTIVTQFRRVVPAVSHMTTVGVERRQAVLSATLPVMGWAAVGGACGAIAGPALGWIAALIGARGYSSPMPIWHLPWQSGVALFFGMVAGSLGALWAVGVRVKASASSMHASPRTRSDRDTSRLRHITAVTLGLGCVYLLLSLRTPWHAFVLVCLTVLLAAILTPEVVTFIIGRQPERSLRQRMVKRLSLRFRLRSAMFVAVITIAIGVGVGILTSVNGAVAYDRSRQASTAPPGLVALDNDNTTSLPVPPAVRVAAERVPSLSEQSPVRLWVTGTPAKLPNGSPDVAGSVSTSTQQGLVYAVESSSDFERLIQRGLASNERELLTKGGMLAFEDAGPIKDGRVRLREYAGSRTYGTVPALRTEVRSAPWLEAVAGYMLTDGARKAGLPVAAAALVYTGVPQQDADQVLLELTAAGIFPENANIHYEQPPAVPDPVLVVSCLVLLLIATSTLTFMSRAQILGMRQWAANLGRLGIPHHWAQRTLIAQQLSLTAIGVLLGAAAGILPQVIAGVRLSRLVVDVPWVQVAAVIVTVVLISAGVMVASARMLRGGDASFSREWE